MRISYRRLQATYEHFLADIKRNKSISQLFQTSYFFDSLAERIIHSLTSFAPKIKPYNVTKAGNEGFLFVFKEPDSSYTTYKLLFKKTPQGDFCLCSNLIILAKKKAQLKNPCLIKKRLTYVPMLYHTIKKDERVKLEFENIFNQKNVSFVLNPRRAKIGGAYLQKVGYQILAKSVINQCRESQGGICGEFLEITNKPRVDFNEWLPLYENMLKCFRGEG